MASIRLVVAKTTTYLSVDRLADVTPAKNSNLLNGSVLFSCDKAVILGVEIHHVKTVINYKLISKVNILILFSYFFSQKSCPPLV